MGVCEILVNLALVCPRAVIGLTCNREAHSMIREFWLSTLALFGAGYVNANETPPPATYVLQVASNLNCAQLDVEVRDEAGQSAGVLVFHTGAFAAVDLSPGNYYLGTVTCHDGDNGTETFDQLADAMAPFSVASSQAYLGGKLIIQTSRAEPHDSSPDVVDECVRGTGRFRKEPNDDCRDGVGIATERAAARAVNFYAPPLKDDEINRIRTAFAASEEDLLYMPLRADTP